MKQTKRILASVLSVILAFSCFAVVPAFAEDLATYEGITGVTLVNQKLHDNYIPEKITFQQVASVIKATVNEKYASASNTLQISDLSQAKFTELIGGRTNLVAGSNSVRYQPWASKDAGTWTDLTAAQITLATDGKIYDLNAGSTPSGFSINNNNDSIENPDAIADRIANGGYDYLITADLGTNVSIDALTLMGHVRTPSANSVFKIYVSNDKETLYTDANEVFYYDQSGMKWSDSVTTNGVYRVDCATAEAKMSQGVWLELGGDKKPYGRYVGVKVIDSCPGSIGYKNWLQVYELGVYGDPAITHLDKTTATSKTWAEKYDLTTADLAEGYHANLQMSALMGTALADKVTGETNKISAIYFGYGNGTGANVSASSVTNLTDCGYYNNNYTSWGTNSTLDKIGYNANTYASFGDSAERVSLDRVANDRYDMYMTLTLSEFTAIEKFYMTAHPEADLSPATYAVFVGNDTDTLYNAENRVFLFDAYNVYKNQNTWKYNGGISGTARGGETQYLEFTGDKLPIGKYVGVKIYDASTRASLPGCVSIADIGVFGDNAGYFAADYATYSFGTTSKNTVVNVGKSGGATILDVEGNEAEIVKMGDTITFKAEPVTDSRHTFLGWYNGDTKVSGDLQYTTTFDGTALEAKYSTDLIFLMTPGENVVAKSSFTNCKPSFGVVDWLYDAEEDAMLIKGQKKTIQGDNPDTEEVEESYEAETLNSALVSTFTIDGENVHTTQYEPWTTYKYSVTLKATGKNLITTAAANGFNFQNQTEQTGYIKYDVTKNQDYVTYDFYFNSGAADYNGAATRSTKFISTNLFNFSGLPDGTNVYVKEMAIEKVNTLMVGNADNATVTPYGAFAPHITDQTSLIADADNTAYGGLTAANAIEALIYDSLAESKVIGSADNGKAMFTVEAAEGYDVTAVKVNGEVVTANEDGVYTYLGAAVDDGIDHDFLADGTKTYVVDVETAVHVHEEVEIPAVPATCTEPGSTAGVKCATCGEILQAPEAIDPLGHEEEVVKGYDATCEEAGLTDGTVCTVCGETVKAQEEIPALGHKMVLNAEKTQLVCENGCGKTVDVNVITFASKDNEVLHEVILEIGQNLTTDDIEAAVAKIPAIYGYEFAGWNDEVNEEVVASRTFTATYKKLEVTYTVTVNHINSVEVLENLPYDSKLTITDKYATQWLIGDVVFAVGSEIVVYVAGDMEITASADEVSTEPSVAVVHEEAIANADSNTYATFARVNAAGKTVKEMGFIYVTGTTYDIVGDENFTMAGVTAADRSYVQAKMPRTGADFMATLEGITTKQEVKRVARAYVIFDDDTVCYSNVVSKIFNEGK